METTTGTPHTSAGVPLIFDTYAVVKDFIAAGFTEKQAEVVTSKIVGVINDNLATKEDIERLRIFSNIEIADIKKDIADLKKDIADLKKDVAGLKKDVADIRKDIEQLRADSKADIAGVRFDIEQLRADTKTDIAGVKADLTKWMFGGFLTMTALLIAILSKLV